MLSLDISIVEHWHGRNKNVAAVKNLFAHPGTTYAKPAASLLFIVFMNLGSSIVSQLSLFIDANYSLNSSRVVRSLDTP